MQSITIQSKIALGTAAAILVTVGAMVAISSRDAYHAAEKTGHLQALAEARSQAAEVKAEIEVALDSARALAHALSGVKAPGAQMTRDQVSAMLAAVLRGHPRFLGVYTAWEPNEFDGKDAEYASKPVHDASGRFIPYWARGAGGAVAAEALADYENQERGPTGARKGEYYLCAKDSGRECVLNPFPYPVQGKEVMMTSLVVPIMVDGRFRGIAGVDIALDTLQARVDGLKLFDGAGRASIVSANGLLVAAQGRADLVGKPAAGYERKDGEIAVAAPMKLGLSDTAWSVGVLLPESVLTAAARGSAWKQVAIGVVIAVLAVIAVLLMVVRGLNRTLLAIVAELRDGADQVTGAAMQVASASQTLAEGANDQAAALADTATSTEQLNAMTRRSTSHSQSVAQMMSETVRDVEAANAVLREMEASMLEIGQSSEKISKIIRTIDEIAFQTNILALNAAVEAARAGEAGMGFAVVADEVRNLAQRAAQAARDTSALIEESIASSKRGGEKVAAVAGAIAAVTGHAGRVREVVDQVSAGSHEQVTGIEQIARAIVRIEQVTKTAAASAEESAAASEELSGQAASVNDIVGRLRELVGDH